MSDRPISLTSKRIMEVADKFKKARGSADDRTKSQGEKARASVVDKQNKLAADILKSNRRLKESSSIR